MRNRTALIFWAYMTALCLAGMGFIIWRMIIWCRPGSTLGVLGLSLIVLGVSAGNAIRMTRAAWQLRKEARRPHEPAA